MLTPDLETINRIMRQQTERALREARQLSPGQISQAPLFSFQPRDVEGIYTHKNGAGMGIWFLLKDGRVFDSSGKPAEADPSHYEAAQTGQPPVISLERPKSST